MPAPWTLERLERACRKALVERARLREVPLTHTFQADVTWVGNEKMRVRVDKHTCALIDGAVHEMLHDVLETDLAPFATDAEEVLISGMEAALSLRIKNSRRRLAWWRSAIQTASKK